MIALHYHQAIRVSQSIQAGTIEPPCGKADGVAHPALRKFSLSK